MGRKKAHGNFLQEKIVIVFLSSFLSFSYAEYIQMAEELWTLFTGRRKCPPSVFRDELLFGSVFSRSAPANLSSLSAFFF